MSILEAILIISGGLSVVGFIGYIVELWRGNVDNYTVWKDLNLHQWVCICLALQFFLVMPTVFIVRLA